MVKKIPFTTYELLDHFISTYYETLRSGYRGKTINIGDLGESLLSYSPFFYTYTFNNLLKKIDDERRPEFMQDLKMGIYNIIQEIISIINEDYSGSAPIFVVGKQAKRNKNDFLSLDLQPRPHPGSASEDVYDKSFDILILTQRRCVGWKH